ncbi:hypothetical protein AG1IA_06007 [Rhizoctonia solani AG-1 IA]|uniref:Uncharacterized protein n=1 Tax=Thanatephorus cucumeris (strain AG1-IA) TaxID=983506 RepID=L8WT83_THACA|nr:hypothetical protein AG1IA_06007 [Rhizoctonia solani AG-1 IA]
MSATMASDIFGRVVTQVYSNLPIQNPLKTSIRKKTTTQIELDRIKPNQSYILPRRSLHSRRPIPLFATARTTTPEGGGGIGLGPWPGPGPGLGFGFTGVGVALGSSVTIWEGGAKGVPYTPGSGIHAWPGGGT